MKCRTARLWMQYIHYVRVLYSSLDNRVHLHNYLGDNEQYNIIKS